jgi:hypothetical protein
MARSLAPVQGVTFPTPDGGKYRQIMVDIVRRTIGYRRFDRLEAAATLARLYAAMHLFVNFFQPSVQRLRELGEHHAQPRRGVLRPGQYAPARLHPPGCNRSRPEQISEHAAQQNPAAEHGAGCPRHAQIYALCACRLGELCRQVGDQSRERDQVAARIPG